MASRDIDRALEYELSLSERLQGEIMKEYHSLCKILDRYDTYRSDDLIQQSSFLEYCERLDAVEKKNVEKRNDIIIEPEKVEEVVQKPVIDLSDQLPLLDMSEFLNRVGKAFSTLPQSSY